MALAALVVSASTVRLGEDMGVVVGVDDRVKAGVGGTDGGPAVHVREHIVHVVERHLAHNRSWEVRPPKAR